MAVRRAAPRPRVEVHRPASWTVILVVEAVMAAVMAIGVSGLARSKGEGPAQPEVIDA